MTNKQQLGGGVCPLIIGALRQQWLRLFGEPGPMDLASSGAPTAPSGSLSAFLSGASRHGIQERMCSPDPGAQHAGPQWSSGEPLETDRWSWLVGPGQRRDL